MVMRDDGGAIGPATHRRLALIEAQVAFLLLRPMALDAGSLEDRFDVAREVHSRFIGQHWEECPEERGQRQGGAAAEVHGADSPMRMEAFSIEPGTGCLP